MAITESFFDTFMPLIVSLALAVLSLSLAHYWLLAREPNLGSEARLPRQIIMLVCTVAAIILAVIVAPLTEGTRNQILSIIGLGISAVIAFSSTSFVTNFMAAITLRVTKPFNIGDFVTVGDYFGKVSERGLFDTEIQTENRELVSIPNSLFILTPVKVTRRSGVIISSTLSLGYDIHHAKVEPLLLLAARAAELDDPYVQILSLDDFSVCYRVSGMLLDVKTLLTSRSKLNQCVLDSLHRSQIEIMSPTVTRHINQPLDMKQIPADTRLATAPAQSAAEDIAFDKADRAQANELQQQNLNREIEELTNQLKQTAGLAPGAKAGIEALVAQLQAELAEISKQPETDET
ncbi:mechanosensitive ion channel family protein [Pseudomonadales bacterium]|nr:mechanosensitive ion channel family protein [Pseudomonadales bacterium]MDB9918294.1 mechanosensitive ion channel family protein [Pseudomonadales bacterium]MDB9942237.1 mechanosensitive ion channel family protein [Pseudomonadales bacterium]MDC1306927.1 mechanosensitive ion channel family protein [Pseudomonadales bacterium]